MNRTVLICYALEGVAVEMARLELQLITEIDQEEQALIEQELQQLAAHQVELEQELNMLH